MVGTRYNGNIAGQHWSDVLTCSEQKIMKGVFIMGIYRENKE